MSNILKLTLICSLIFHVLMGKAAGIGELKQIKENYRQMLIPSSIEQDSLLSDLIKIKPEKEMSDQAVVELHQLYPFDLKKIDGYLSLMSADGSWTDINYADTKRSGWEPKLHAERILELSKLYYSKTTEYYHSEKVKEAIHLALKYWFDTKPRCLNWWYNQIGIPKTLVSLGLVKLSGEYAKAFGYFLTKLGRNLESGTMIRKAQTAVILQKAGHKTEADEFIASIKEHLVQTDEMGAHFAFHANPYTWGMMPVPAHVAVMEALREAGGNDALVEEMKLWLLKQKQTTSWDSPVATADAVYALLCQGSNLLESKGDVRITLGDKVLETFSPAKTTVPGLGYVKEVFAQGSPEVKAKSVTVEKRDAGIAWGAVYAQFLSPISDVKQQGGALNIEKKLFVERISADGQKSLQPLTEVAQLFVGDKIVSRLTVRLDRAMDFVQLKDQRGACFEPENSLSGYRWNNGVGYYAEVEDAGTNFFFDHLGKGVYVLEHSYRVARGGTYETGLATVQCAYAPEYASHSAGGTVIIK